MHLHFSGPAFETLGAVPAICKGVMYYRTLNGTSKLYLARAHLAIRIDEWPHEPFSRPMDFPEDQIANVWIPPSPETTALKVVNLMHGDCLHGEADGADVRGHIHEAKDEGPSAGSLLPKANGHDHADDGDRCPGSAQQPAELPERSSHLSSRQRLAKLRRWRQEDDHLRSMRCSLDPEHRQGQVIDPMCAKGITPLKLPAHVLERKEYPLHTEDIGRARSSTETARRSSTRGSASSSAGARLSPSLSLKQAKPKIIPSSVSFHLTAHNLAQQQQEIDEDASMRSWEAPEVPYATADSDHRNLQGRARVTQRAFFRTTPRRCTRAPMARWSGKLVHARCQRCNHRWCRRSWSSTRTESRCGVAPKVQSM